MKQLSKQTKAEVGINKVVELNSNYKLKLRNVKSDISERNKLLDFIDGLTLILKVDKLEEPEIVLIADFLCSEFQDFTIEEIKEAIFKAKSGSLKIDSAHYNKLDIDYLGKVLNAYKKLRSDEVLRQRQKDEAGRVKNASLQVAKVSSRTNKQSFEYLKDFYKEKKYSYKSNTLKTDVNKAFEYAEEQKLIELSNDEKSIFMDDVIFSLEQGKSDAKFSNNHIALLGIDMVLNNKELLKKECRQRMLINYFKNVG